MTADDLCELPPQARALIVYACIARLAERHREQIAWAVDIAGPISQDRVEWHKAYPARITERLFGPPLSRRPHDLPINLFDIDRLESGLAWAAGARTEARAQDDDLAEARAHMWTLTELKSAHFALWGVDVCPGPSNTIAVEWAGRDGW